MRFALNLVAMIVVALAVGFGLSWFALSDGRVVGAFRSGPWVAWPAMGSPQPDPYARAALSRNGSLQIGIGEGIRFTASTDDSGQALRRACDYRIEGVTPVAAFWTLAALDETGANVARPDGPLALRSSDLARKADGSAVIAVGKRPSPNNWLEVSGDGAFQLALTLYDAAAFSGTGPAVSRLPAIRNVGCA